MLDRPALAAALIFASCLSTTAARADTIFDSFGPNLTFDGSTQNMLVSGGAENVQAVRFVPTSTRTITHVTAAMRSTGGNGVSSLFARVVTDSGGLPGTTVLWTSSTVLIAPTPPSPYVFTSPNAATLNAGQTYWLVLDATLSGGNAAAALPGLPNVMGQRAHRSGPGPWTLFNPGVLPALRIEGVATVACCNTATGGCTALSSAACATLGLRSDGPGSTCSPTSCRACPADFNHNGVRSVQDIFDFLQAYFAGC